MKKTNMDDYCSLMSDIALPNDVRHSVLDGAARLRDERRTPSALASSSTRRRPLAHGLAIGTCALVLATTLAIVGGILPSPSSLVDSDESGNSFTLAAYAAGEPGKEGQAVSLKRDFGTLAGFGWSDSNNMESAYLQEERTDSLIKDTKGFASTHLFLNLTCVGKNVDTLTYSIEGDGVYFYQENWNYGPPPTTIGPDPDPQIKKSFTISYDEQAKDKSAVQRQLYMFFPLDEKASEAYNANGGPSSRNPPANSTSEDWFKQLEAETFRQFAEEIVEHPITLTATFKDGSTQTNTYLIAPTSDFDQQLENHRTSTEEHLRDLSAYFTLTEIVEK